MRDRTIDILYAVILSLLTVFIVIHHSALREVQRSQRHWDIEFNRHMRAHSLQEEYSHNPQTSDHQPTERD